VCISAEPQNIPCADAKTGAARASPRAACIVVHRL
jgi:hypothetical protein